GRQVRAGEAPLPAGQPVHRTYPRRGQRPRLRPRLQRRRQARRRRRPPDRHRRQQRTRCVVVDYCSRQAEGEV
ncbi:MAG: hypothetical protein AVDCRST_MAG68-5039, partial [uncultured Gemmatimonadetes bacterium]